MFYREIFMYVVEIKLNVDVLFKYWFVYKKFIKWDVYVNGIVRKFVECLINFRLCGIIIECLYVIIIFLYVGYIL